jgi:peroxiredoxin
VGEAPLPHSVFSKVQYGWLFTLGLKLRTGGHLRMEHAVKKQGARILITLALLAMAGSGLAGGDSRTKLRQAPDFLLYDFLGNKVSLADFRGQVVLLEFFQSGCRRCQQEAPLLERLYRNYQNKGVVIVGISHDAGREQAVKKFAGDFGIAFPLLLGDLEVAVRYIGITPQHSSFAIPHYFLIDRHGTIVQEFLPGDETSPDQQVANMEQAIKDALARSPATSPASTSSPD